MKMCVHFKLIVKMGAGAEQEYTIEKEKKILNQIQPVSCPAQAPPAPFPSPLHFALASAASPKPSCI